jgi:hypothetical protein
MNNLQMNVQILKPADVNDKVGLPDSAPTVPGRPFGITLVVGMASVLLSACGGGGADAAGTDVTAATKVSTTTIKVTPTVPPTVFTPSTPAQPAAPTVGATITDIKIQNTSAAQTNVPFTFGHVFAIGNLLPTEGLVGKLADGSTVRLQTDVKATHADGSVRHAVISGILPTLAASETQTIQLAKSSVTEQGSATPQSLIDAGLSSSINVTLDKVDYSASLATALSGATPIKWLSGPIANEWIVSTPLRTANGTAHPHLTARFAVRSYPGLVKQARVEAGVENMKTFVGGAQNFTYDVTMQVAGRTVYSQANLTHYHHARWHQLAWWDAAHAPEIHVKHNTPYLIATKAVSNYDQSLAPGETILADYAKQNTKDTTGPMTIGPLLAAMGTTGGRPDIGSLPSWSVNYLLSQDKRAKDLMMAAADGSGTWPIHYRDENTGFPVRIDNEKNKLISTHYNLSLHGPLPVPRCKDGDWDKCSTPISPDDAHQPSIAFLPYLITGEYYYLEELQFWAAINPLGTDPGYSGNGLGLVRWQQLRGQAWSMRTLGHAAYITPDNHYMKSYFNKQLDNNLEFYQKLFLAPTANAMGVYDGIGEGVYVTDGYSPWQDDFFTWSFGYLSELGFTKAEPILQWKAKYPVGRITAPGFCWIQASKYFYNFSDGPGAPRYKTFAELYAGNFKENNIRDDNSGVISHPAGLKYNDQPCASQAQSDWFVAAGIPWMIKGRMVGYADSPLGYPANMQPALAVSVASGIPNAATAWSTFMGRSAKPDYRSAPQWAIIPR